QAAGRSLPARLHERRELLGSFLRVGCGRAFDSPRHLLDLPALYLFEPGADALCDLAFLALDALQQLALAAAEPFVELVQRTSAIGCVRVDFVVCTREHLVEGLVQLRAKPLNCGALLLAVRR